MKKKNRYLPCELNYRYFKGWESRKIDKIDGMKKGDTKKRKKFIFLVNKTIDITEDRDWRKKIR